MTTFLGCDGAWLLNPDGSTACSGQLRTYTVQEMRDQLVPALSLAQKAELTGAMLGLLVAVWVFKKMRTTIPH